MSDASIPRPTSSSSGSGRVDDRPLRRSISRESKENPLWLTLAHQTMKKLITDSIHGGPDFTADDLTSQIDDKIQPISRNSIGSLFRSYSQAEFITCVGYGQSRAKKRNGGGRRIWKATGKPVEIVGDTGTTDGSDDSIDDSTESTQPGSTSGTTGVQDHSSDTSTDTGADADQVVGWTPPRHHDNGVEVTGATLPYSDTETP